MAPAFTVPPPLPPTDFSGLTDSELRAMEGNERQNLEARIRCLRNIQVLLDAAVLEMQQYTAVVSRVGAHAQSAAPNATEESSRDTGARPRVRPEDNHDGQNIVNRMDRDIGQGNSTASNGGTAADQELRQRRLARFDNPTE
jgi:E3 ubiquitin-protein ligase synoviolin